MILPTRNLERSILESLPAGTLLAGVDEVGRGSLAGPVGVGIAVVDNTTSDEFPPTLRDSKLLKPAARSALVEPIHSWVRAGAVGYASAAEIDAWGIIGGLQAAAARAASELFGAGFAFSAVLLDGVHDWWSPASLLDEHPLPPAVPVTTAKKADANCAVVAAASNLAKVERDALMVDLDALIPGYDWAQNKGYGSPAHIEGLRRHGASEYHRRSWHLPGLNEVDSNE